MSFNFRSGLTIYLLAVFASVLAFTQLDKAEAQPTLKLVSARDNIEGAFLIEESIYADKDRIYLASYQGKLFVLARDRASNFPIIQLIHEDNSILTAVTGDEENVYVTTRNGTLRIYKKEDTFLRLVSTLTNLAWGLNSVKSYGDSIFIGTGYASIAVDDLTQRLFVSQFHSTDVVYRISKSTLEITQTYAETYEQNKIVAFDLASGQRIGAMDSPPGGLFIHGTKLTVSHGGCCGPIPILFNTVTLARENPDFYWFANAVTQIEQPWLIAGNEAGLVQIFDLSRQYAPLVSEIRLREATGHTGIEDIEIRAIWMDGYDNLIFGGSSWGNDQSRGPSLPSFFVLELVQPTPTPTPSPTPTPPPVQIQINSGGERFSERGTLRLAAIESTPAGQFVADQYYSGGDAWTFNSNNAVSGAGDNAPLYRSVRYSYRNFRYSIPVPNGNYKMKLRFMEGDPGYANKSPFSVMLNNKKVLSYFDVAREAGGVNKALDLEFPVIVSDGNGVNALFSSDSSSGRAMVSAVELVSADGSFPSPTPTSLPQQKAVFLVNAGGGAYKSSVTGNNFQNDRNFSGGDNWTWSGLNISGTEEKAALYKSVRYSYKNFQYMFPVGNGNYSVKLRFMEGDRGYVGRSPFTVKINGDVVLNKFDVGTNAGGANIAVDEQFSAMAIGGKGITVDFINSGGGRAMVSALEVFSDGPVAASSKVSSSKKPTVKKPKKPKKPAKPKKPSKPKKPAKPKKPVAKKPPAKKTR